jgi:hypothetical protein
LLFENIRLCLKSEFESLRCILIALAPFSHISDKVKKEKEEEEKREGRRRRQ